MTDIYDDIRDHCHFHDNRKVHDLLFDICANCLLVCYKSNIVPRPSTIYLSDVWREIGIQYIKEMIYHKQFPLMAYMALVNNYELKAVDYITLSHVKKYGAHNRKLNIKLPNNSLITASIIGQGDTYTLTYNGITGSLSTIIDAALSRHDLKISDNIRQDPWQCVVCYTNDGMARVRYWHIKYMVLTSMIRYLFVSCSIKPNGPFIRMDRLVDTDKVRNKLKEMKLYLTPIYE